MLLWALATLQLLQAGGATACSSVEAQQQQQQRQQQQQQQWPVHGSATSLQAADSSLQLQQQVLVSQLLGNLQLSSYKLGAASAQVRGLQRVACRRACASSRSLDATTPALLLSERDAWLLCATGLCTHNVDPRSAAPTAAAGAAAAGAAWRFEPAAAAVVQADVAADAARRQPRQQQPDSRIWRHAH
jgi:hypothetical protein